MYPRFIVIFSVSADLGRSSCTLLVIRIPPSAIQLDGMWGGAQAFQGGVGALGFSWPTVSIAGTASLSAPRIAAVNQRSVPRPLAGEHDEVGVDIRLVAERIVRQDQ